MIREKQQNVLYHYTDARGFLGIVNKEKQSIILRFSYYNFLNDSQEGNELQRIFDIVCREMYEAEELTSQILKVQIKHHLS